VRERLDAASAKMSASSTSPPSSKSPANSASSVYEFSVERIDGSTTSLAEHRNQVLLIVNVASHCGFTPQYEGLEALYRKHRDAGLVVLGFPCNQFGAQEPGTHEEIAQFCAAKYQVTFPLYAKIDVNGESAHPLYRWLKTQAKGVLGTESIKWNFTKFLLDRRGNVMDRFAPATTPEQIESSVVTLLKESV
jgi:glutathione peroxidase